MYSKPRSVMLSATATVMTNGVFSFSASWEMLYATGLWYGPSTATTPSRISRSASAVPTSGLPWLSPPESASRAPPCDLIPPAALISSTARVRPFTTSPPSNASGPDSGWT